MAKHTLGPWNFKRSEIGHPDNAKNPIVISVPLDRYIARMFCAQSTVAGCISNAPATLDEAEANARLIGAAPDLLAACKALLQLWDDNHPDEKCGCLGASDDCQNPPPCELCSARSAIALAESTDH